MLGLAWLGCECVLLGVLDQNILGRRQDLPDGVNEIGFTGVTFFFAHLRECGTW